MIVGLIIDETSRVLRMHCRLAAGSRPNTRSFRNLLVAFLLQLFEPLPVTLIDDMVSSACPDHVPLVIVEGFFSSAGALVWGNIHEHSNHLVRADGREDRRVIFSR